MISSWSSLRFGILPLEDFELAALAAFMDALRFAGGAADIRCAWNILSLDMEPIRADSGIAIQPDAPLSDPSQIDYLVVIGGASPPDRPIPEDVTRLLRSAAEGATRVIALRSGVFALAEAGLLDGCGCSVELALHMDFSKRFPRTIPLPDAFVIDGCSLTCAENRGVSDLAAHVASAHHGRTGLRETSTPLSSSAQDPLVVAALLWMGQNLEIAQTIEDLARDMRVSRRKLERHFRADIGKSPQKAYMSLRLAKAKRLLRTTDESISEIALSCGFCDASHLVRLMKGNLGMTPAQIRKVLDTRDDEASAP
ncbi:helix-turn-helix domain-containing protein [Sinirhodobacter populi]|uniref:Helix-turn-helix domain-containing protein n=1 Tax=Paenirhodobacter populi TaxID=2306993 RepID=A0A443K2C3_9RHOB|nr:helix-turn-helix domain-containing protein [Sinirhodobacter populi]RWR26919.1 helix-turn-helix domain-containing protein [Sinirhodobacter populi]